MAVDIKDIKVWAVSRGISHVVAAQVSLGTETACGTIMVGDARRKTRTSKICEKCRERLKDATATDSSPTAAVKGST